MTTKAGRTTGHGTGHLGGADAPTQDLTAPSQGVATPTQDVAAPAPLPGAPAPGPARLGFRCVVRPALSLSP